jgi:hypothetical protein
VFIILITRPVSTGSWDVDDASAGLNALRLAVAIMVISAALPNSPVMMTKIGQTTLFELLNS